jgi:hypothetical protein
MLCKDVSDAIIPASLEASIKGWARYEILKQSTSGSLIRQSDLMHSHVGLQGEEPHQFRIRVNNSMAFDRAHHPQEIRIVIAAPSEFPYQEYEHSHPRRNIKHLIRG